MALYKPGQSGNPNGRPKGIKTKKTLIREGLDAISNIRCIDARRELIEAVYDAALDGDMAAANLLINRLEPSYKAVQQPIELPVNTPTDLFEKGKFILKLFESGDLSPDAAKELIDSVLKLIKVQESDETIKRLDELEAKANDKSN